MKSRSKYLKYTAYIVLICFVGFIIAHFFVQRTVVRGSSMNPVLSSGDNLIVDRLAPKTHTLKRYDIVVFTYLYKEKTYFIKRVIGLPGETVQITDDGTVLINGKALDDKYGTEKIKDPGLAEYPIKLKANEYFVLGDNRNHSEDSRFSDVGAVHKEQIIGRVIYRFFPFRKAGRVR
ncbi:MAG: signal peptidase I [Lachnospiraceae bacterium]|nr:signal peptidase I [Lachnospiraceae bacterium]